MFYFCIFMIIWAIVGFLGLCELSINTYKRISFEALPLHKQAILGILLFSPIIYAMLLIVNLILGIWGVIQVKFKLDKCYNKIYNWLWDIK